MSEEVSRKRPETLFYLLLSDCLVPSYMESSELNELKCACCTSSGSNNPCSVFNGGCSHSCHPGPDGQVECACPEGTGLEIRNNGKVRVCCTVFIFSFL